MIEPTSSSIYMYKQTESTNIGTDIGNRRLVHFQRRLVGVLLLGLGGVLPDPSQVPHLRHRLKLAGILAPKQKVSVRLELCVKWMQQNLLVRKLRCINLSFLGAIFFLLNRGFSWSLEWHVCSGRMLKRYWKESLDPLGVSVNWISLKCGNDLF